MKSLERYSLWIALRPFSLVVALISCALGVLIAWQDGYQDVLVALLVVGGGVLAQAGINLINDIEDVAGLADHPERTGVLAMIRRNQWVGIVCFAGAALIALYLIWLRGQALFWVVLFSGIAALSYNMGPFSFKHRGLALIQVFVLMGVVMVQGSYLVMSGHFSMLALLHSLPVSLLVSLLLLSNELRDWESDRRNGIGTLAVRIGYRNSVRLYWLLILGAYLLALVIAFSGQLHQVLWLLLPLPLLVPIQGYLHAARRPRLTPLTGRFFFLFGLGYLLALGAG